MGDLKVTHRGVAYRFQTHVYSTCLRAEEAVYKFDVRRATAPIPVPRHGPVSLGEGEARYLEIRHFNDVGAGLSGLSVEVATLSGEAWETSFERAIGDGAALSAEFFRTALVVSEEEAALFTPIRPVLHL